MSDNLRNWTLITIFTALLIAGCGINETEVDEPAQATVELTFVESESGDPVAGVEVSVDAIYEGDTEPVFQGALPTDAAGEINAVITNPNEVVITTLIFSLNYNGEEHVFEEEVNLELRVEAPYESVNFTFEVDTTPEGDNPE